MNNKNILIIGGTGQYGMTLSQMLSKKGRSSKLGERSIGHIDPGAASSFIIIKSIYESIKNMN